jgi:hypothetical protein
MKYYIVNPPAKEPKNQSAQKSLGPYFTTIFIPSIFRATKLIAIYKDEYQNAKEPYEKNYK